MVHVHLPDRVLSFLTSSLLLMGEFTYHSDWSSLLYRNFIVFRLCMVLEEQKITNLIHLNKSFGTARKRML